MPRGDRTGPTGMGPMSGRAAGYCAGSGMPGYAVAAPGRGLGMAFGRGRGAWGRGFSGGGRRGWRNMFYATGLPGAGMRFGGHATPFGVAAPSPYRQPDPEMEKQVLKQQADSLQAELDMIKKRMTEIDTSDTSA